MDKIALITIIKKVEKFHWTQEDTCVFTELTDAVKYLESLGYKIKPDGKAWTFKNEELNTLAQIKTIDLNRSFETTKKEEN